MDYNGLSIKKYEEAWENQWDDFVLNQSVNGTFLQTRNFLNYHPRDRFVDASHMVFDAKGRIIAVCPACLVNMDGKNTLYSHRGSTYGGIIISEKWYKTHKVIEIIKALESQWADEKIERVILKQTPDILSARDNALIDYCFYYLRYEAKLELNLYVDIFNCKENLLSGIAQGKRTNVHNCEKAGCECRKLQTTQEIENFHRLLRITLQKYGKEPVHTIEELLEFKDKRLKDECDFYGIFQGNKMLAGAMMFYFCKEKVAHSQYLCADPEYHTLSPMSYMYYSMLCEARKKGYERVSWGIVTEDMGMYLNEGLTMSKEAFGSTYGVNRTYIKQL